MLVVAYVPLVLPWIHLLSDAHLILAHLMIAHLILAHSIHAHWIPLHLMPADWLHAHLLVHLLFGQLGIPVVRASSERSPKRFLSSPWLRPAIFISQ